MATAIDGIIEPFLARVALGSGLLAFDDSGKVERVLLLEDLNRYKIENERVKMLILVVNVAMRAMSPNYLDMEKKVVTIQTEKVFLSILNEELLASESWKGLDGTRTDDDFIESILSMYDRFALHFEKTIVLYCC